LSRVGTIDIQSSVHLIREDKGMSHAETVGFHGVTSTVIVATKIICIIEIEEEKTPT
jgi:hypothetical protein